jgi:hypothetical protein
MDANIQKDAVANSMLSIGLISASGLFGLAFYNRLIIIIERLRRLNRELLAENDRDGSGRPNRMKMISTQISTLNCAASTMKFSIIAVLCGAMSTITSALVIAINQDNAYEIARIFHILALCLIMLSFTLACGEMSFSLFHVMREEKHIIKEVSEGNLIEMNRRLNP